MRSTSVDVRLARRHSQRESRAARRVLNAGSGFFSRRQLHPVFTIDNWRQVSLDIDPNTEPDIVSSITNLQKVVPTGSFDAVFCSHTLEHLYAHEVPLAISEFKRVLKNDGFVLIRSPDLETATSLIVKHGTDYVAYRSPAGPITPLEMLFGHTASIARGRKNMGHKTGFTSGSLGKLLLAGGFPAVLVKRDNFDLWALAMTSEADETSVLGDLLSAGLDFTDHNANHDGS